MGQLISVAGDVSVPSQTRTTTVEAPPPGSPVDNTWDFNSGSVNTSAGGSDGFSSPMDSIYSRDVTPAEGVQCCKCSIPAGTTGFGNWGGIRNLPQRVGPGNEFWVSIKVFHPSGFAFTSNSDLGIKHLRVRRTLDSNNTTTDGYFDLLLKSNGISASLESTEFRNKYPNNTYVGLGPNIVLGRWNTYEIYSSLKSDSTGIIRWWANGDLMFTADGIVTMPSGSSADAFYFLTYWNDDAANIKAQSLYCDQIRFTTTRPENQDAAGNWMIGI